MANENGNGNGNGQYISWLLKAGNAMMILLVGYLSATVMKVDREIERRTETWRRVDVVLNEFQHLKTDIEVMKGNRFTSADGMRVQQQANENLSHIVEIEEELQELTECVRNLERNRPCN